MCGLWIRATASYRASTFSRQSWSHPALLRLAAMPTRRVFSCLSMFNATRRSVANTSAPLPFLTL